MTVRLPKPLSRDELRALDRAAYAMGRPDLGACMTFLEETGLRVAEAAALTAAEGESWPYPGRFCRVGCRRHVVLLRVTGKGAGSMHEGGGKERVVVLTPRALRAARVMLRHPSKNGRADLLLPWGERGLRYALVRAGEIAGVPGVSPHRFRHTFAQSLVDAGADVQTVADMMGHSDIDTTRLYFYASPTSKVRALRLRARFVRRSR